jgi:hypothetical protein
MHATLAEYASKMRNNIFQNIISSITLFFIINFLILVGTTINILLVAHA